MVGVEAADLLVTRDCKVTVVEMLASAAQGMARNNKMELLDRLQAAGVRIMLNTRILGMSGGNLEISTSGAMADKIAIGAELLIAIGPKPNRDVVAVVEAAQVPYVLVGDCNQPGDFLSCLRDGWMAGLAVERSAAGAA